jgi:hypothetical protein
VIDSHKPTYRYRSGLGECIGDFSHSLWAANDRCREDTSGDKFETPSL